MTEHFAIFDESCHSSSFSIRVSKLLWICDDALALPRNFVKSANRPKFVWKMAFIQMSMYIMNKLGGFRRHVSYVRQLKFILEVSWMLFDIMLKIQSLSGLTEKEEDRTWQN